MECKNVHCKGQHPYSYCIALVMLNYENKPLTVLVPLYGICDELINYEKRQIFYKTKICSFYQLYCFHEIFIKIFTLYNTYRVLARPYLMTLHVIFPIHLNFPIMCSCVLKAIIHRKKQWIVLQLLEKAFLFQKDDFYLLLYMHVVFD